MHYQNECGVLLITCSI